MNYKVRYLTRVIEEAVMDLNEMGELSEEDVDAIAEIMLKIEVKYKKQQK